MEKRFPESHFDAKSRGLVGSLLLPKQSERLGRSGAGALKNHPFFKDVDFATLHRAQPPKIQGSGAARPKGNEWARRSFSIMHAPIPDAYAFDDSGVDGGCAQGILETELERHSAWSSSSGSSMRWGRDLKSASLNRQQRSVRGRSTKGKGRATGSMGRGFKAVRGGSFRPSIASHPGLRGRLVGRGRSRIPVTGVMPSALSSSSAGATTTRNPARRSRYGRHGAATRDFISNLHGGAG